MAFLKSIALNFLRALIIPFIFLFLIYSDLGFISDGAFSIAVYPIDLIDYFFNKNTFGKISKLLFPDALNSAPFGFLILFSFWSFFSLLNFRRIAKSLDKISSDRTNLASTMP